MTEIIKLDLRRHLNKTGIIIFLFFLLSSLFLNQTSMKKLERLEIIKEAFIKSEIKKVENCNNYRQYGAYGFNLLFVTCPISSIFNPTTLNSMQSNSDTGFKFDISNPQKGEYIFQRDIGLSWFLIIIVGGFSMVFGWFALRNREFLKLLASYGSKFSVYSSILAARAILLILSLFILTFCLITQYYLNGINLTASEILIIIKFMLFTFGILFIFLLFGLVLGTIKKVITSGTLTFFCWLIFLLLWPQFFNLAISEKAGNMRTIYSIEAEKVKLLSEFEKNRLDFISDKEDKIKATKEFTGKFLNEGKVEKLELDLLEETGKIVKKYHLWSIFNPATFYESTCNELSGKGFGEHRRFYRESLLKKREFIRYCLDKMFQVQSGKVEPFLRGDEYIFYAKPGLPHYFRLGLPVHFFYILMLFGIGFWRFKKILFASRDEYDRHVPEKFIINEKGYNVWYARDRSLTDMLFNIFSKKEHEKFSGKTAEIACSKGHFFYICRPDEIPGNIKVKDLIIFHAGKENKTLLAAPEIKAITGKTFAEISNKQKFTALLALLKKKREAIYLLDDIDQAVDINTVALDETMRELIQQGSVVIFISRSANEVELIKENTYFEDQWDLKTGALRSSLKLAKKSKKKGDGNLEE